MIKSLRLTLAAPITLALAACGGGADEATDGAIEGEAIAAIAAPAGTEWRDTVATTELGGTLVGNPEAPLKLVEFGSLTCPTCARFSVEGVPTLLEKYVNSGVVSFELRNFAVHGPLDLLLGRMVRCGTPEAVVPLSDQVWANYDTIMAPTQSNPQGFEAAMALPAERRFVAAADAFGYYDFFAQRGISEDQARACLADTGAIEKLANDSQRYSTEFNVSGTPTFHLNGKPVQANTWVQLEPILQRAGAR